MTMVIEDPSWTAEFGPCPPPATGLDRIKGILEDYEFARRTMTRGDEDEVGLALIAAIAAARAGVTMRTIWRYRARLREAQEWAS